MIPTSFIPMIAKFVLGDKILPKIMEHIAKTIKTEILENDEL